jgi:ornithine decarboxylase antizyme 1
MRGLDSGFDVTRAGWDFPEGTCAGYKGYPSVPEIKGYNHPIQVGGEQAVKLSFSAAGVGGARSCWEAVLWQNRLYVMVTQAQLADGSKAGFVSLLEYAEEELGVEHVIACLDRSYSNKNIVRNFLFLGFTPLSPGHEYFPANPNVVCFLYTI